MRAHFEVYEDEAGEWRWRLVAANGEIVIPPEGHRDATDAERAMNRTILLISEIANNDRIEALPPETDKPHTVALDGSISAGTEAVEPHKKRTGDVPVETIQPEGGAE